MEVKEHIYHFNATPTEKNVAIKFFSAYNLKS